MNRISRNDNFESRRVGEIGLGRLRMIQSSVTNSTPRCSKCQLSTLELAPRSISILGSLVYDLVESGEDVIAKLDLGDGSVPSYGYSNREPSNTLF